MTTNHYKRAMVTHQEGRYLDDEDDVFFNTLGRTRRRVPGEWDEPSLMESLIWKSIGIDD
jgi:hypothetical protein